MKEEAACNEKITTRKGEVTMKRTLSVVLGAAMVFSLAACGGKGGDPSSETKAQNAEADTANTASADPGLETEITSTDPITIRLAYDVAESHPSHKAFVEKFQNALQNASNGNITVELYPNSQLGSLAENMEAMRIGDLEMAALNDSIVAGIVPEYNLVGLPFLWTSLDAAHEAMDGDFGQALDKKLEEQAGITTLAWGDVGFRNLTNSKHSVTSPDDLKGLKIRVQDMKSQTDMMKALGGIPVAMSYGDVYTSLQTGIIDGTENNETALTTGKHGEICKVYSTDQHAMIPDVMVMSAKVWKEISPEDQQIILEAARESTESHKIAWDTAIDQAIEEAKNTMGVEFVNDVDKEAFREATSGMINDYCTQYPGVKKLLDIIDSVE